MKDFDPFRLSQQFTPEQVDGDLPPLGLLEWEEEENKSSSKNYLFLCWLLPLFALLSFSIWSQSDSSKPLIKHRSVFE